MIFGPSLLIYEISSIAVGYASLDQLLKEFNLKIVESSMIPPGRLLNILQGQSTVTTKAKAWLEMNHARFLEDIAVVEKTEEQLLGAIYAQNQTAVKETLTIIETLTTSSLAGAANNVSSEGKIKIVDFRIARSLGGKSCLFLTGQAADMSVAIKKIVAQIPSEKVISYQTIQNPHKELLKSFNLNGA